MSAGHRRGHPAPPLERLAHFRGSALTARDLRDLIAYEERLLRLHVCTLHERRAPSPRVAFGVAGPGALAWARDGHAAVALVDTREAELDDVPLYFASLSGGVGVSSGLVGPFVTIDRALRRSFTLRVAVASHPPMAAPALVASLLPHLRETAVLWIAVERAARCASAAPAAPDASAPAPDLSTIATWLGGHP